MKRKALLIGPKYFASPLLGVQNDMFEWKKFLKSSTGGGWYDEEILEVVSNGKNLSKELFFYALSEAHEADYIFIAFSGHGKMCQRDNMYLSVEETCIYINDNDYIFEHDMIPKGYKKRCTIILDCCRNREAETYGLIKEAIDESVANLTRSRQIFDLVLGLTEYGLTKVYSTQPNHDAQDRYSFTHYLIKSAIGLAANKKNSMVTLREAVLSANELIKDYGQQAVYDAGRRLFHVPFAISNNHDNALY